MTIFKDLPESEYHSRPEVSKSQLWKMAKSPKHFKYALDNPKAATAAMDLGSLVHTIILEPGEVANRYAVAPKVDKRTKAGKEEWAKFVEESAGKTLVDDDTWHKAIAISQAVRDHVIADSLLQGDAEISIIWECLGVPCRSRLDMVNGDNVIVDLKTTRDLATFPRDAGNLGYHVQAAFYVDALKAETGEEYDFAFVAVETEAPYDCVVYWVSEADIRAGRQKYYALLEQYLDCQLSGNWPGIADEIVTLQIPGWAK